MRWDVLGQIKQISALRKRLVSEKATDTDEQIKALKENLNLMSLESEQNY